MYNCGYLFHTFYTLIWSSPRFKRKVICQIIYLLSFNENIKRNRSMNKVLSQSCLCTTIVVQALRPCAVFFVYLFSSSYASTGYQLARDWSESELCYGTWPLSIFYWSDKQFLINSLICVALGSFYLKFAFEAPSSGQNLQGCVSGPASSSMCWATYSQTLFSHRLNIWKRKWYGEDFGYILLT